MNNYKNTFAQLKKDNKIAFIPFWMIGDPTPEKSEEIIEILAKSSDVLELGIPFSDPLADGPTIQASINRALDAGTTTEKCFRIIKNIRQKFPEKPIGLLVYFNLILSYKNGEDFRGNIKNFFIDAAKIGVDSILIPEIPVEEIKIVEDTAKNNNIDLIFLVSTNTPENRVEKIIQKSGGFIYAVSTPSITGAKTDISQKTLDMVRTLKQKTDLPICVGFGISSPEHVKLLKENNADGAIIGSKLFEFRDDLDALNNFCQKCKDV
jgi:tryptophan synthase alpha chain